MGTACIPYLSNHSKTKKKEGMTDTMEDFSEKELFETMPVPKAVATLAIPTIISQIVTIIYNLADTFFIGQLGNPYMVAAVTLVSPGLIY